MDKVTLLIVVPVYNEARILKDKLDRLYEYISATGIDFYMVLSVDESGDNSVKIAEEFSSSHKQVGKIIHKTKMGRGFAVREAWSLYEAEFYAFIDADLATGLEIIKRCYDMSVKNGTDVIVASRYTYGAKVSRPPLRNSVSKVYNTALRVIFHEKIKDHQCGFKIINSKARNVVLDRTTVDSWFWDTELLVMSQKLGLNLVEVPVNWVEQKYGKTSLRRLLSDVWLHGTGIIHLIGEVAMIRKYTQTKQFLPEVDKESAD